MDVQCGVPAFLSAMITAPAQHLLPQQTPPVLLSLKPDIPSMGDRGVRQAGWICQEVRAYVMIGVVQTWMLVQQQLQETHIPQFAFVLIKTLI